MSRPRTRPEPGQRYSDTDRGTRLQKTVAEEYVQSVRQPGSLAALTNASVRYHFETFCSDPLKFGPESRLIAAELSKPVYDQMVEDARLLEDDQARRVDLFHGDIFTGIATISSLHRGVVNLQNPDGSTKRGTVFKMDKIAHLHLDFCCAPGSLVYGERGGTNAFMDSICVLRNFLASWYMADCYTMDISLANRPPCPELPDLQVFNKWLQLLLCKDPGHYPNKVEIVPHINGEETFYYRDPGAQPMSSTIWKVTRLKQPKTVGRT